MEGIPYMGSKRKLAHRIVDVIFNRHNSEKFYDLFGGGGLFRQTRVSGSCRIINVKTKIE